MGNGKRIAAIVLVLFLVLSFLLPVTLMAEEAQPEGELPEIAAESYLLLDLDTGQVLMGRDPHRQMYPASITKIVTLGLAQEALNNGTIALDTQVEVSQRAVTLISGAASIYLEAGEVVSVEDLMYGTQIRSANDAANALAELLGGSIEGFADMMNAKVAALGLTGTHFTNPHGLPDNDHYTTAYDMGVLTNWAMGVPGFAEWFGALSYDMPPTNTHDIRLLGTSNYILLEETSWYYEGVTGSKNGYTNDAGYTLVTTAERDGKRLACVVMACELNDQKYTDTASLLDYGFYHFNRVTLPATGLETANVPVYAGGEEPIGEIRVHAAGEIAFMLMDRLDSADVRMEYQVPERYVVGDDFAPTLSVTLPNNAGQYEGVLQVALEWDDLDSIFSANTTAFQRARSAGGESWWWLVPVVLLATLALFGLLVTVRLVYERRVRLKRRQQRLARQRLQGANGYPYTNPNTAPARVHAVQSAPYRPGAQRAGANRQVVYYSKNKPADRRVGQR